MNVLRFLMGARAEDARACRAFIRGTHHPSAAFVCVGTGREVEAQGAHNMDALQLLALAAAVLTSARDKASACPCDDCRAQRGAAEATLAALVIDPSQKGSAG